MHAVVARTLDREHLTAPRRRAVVGSSCHRRSANVGVSPARSAFRRATEGREAAETGEERPA
eukprot:6212898-Pleurochrysis_carterae.AAC.1